MHSWRLYSQKLSAYILPYKNKILKEGMGNSLLIKRWVSRQSGSVFHADLYSPLFPELTTRIRFFSWNVLHKVDGMWTQNFLHSGVSISQIPGHVHTMKAYGAWRYYRSTHSFPLPWIVRGSVTFQPLSPSECSFQQALNRWIEKVRTFSKRDVIFPVQGIEPQVPRYPIRSLVTVPTELLRLPYYSTGSSWQFMSNTL